MISKHLAEGSECPPRVKGVSRVYSMEYCPYAQRARLVVIAKKVNHEVINIDLKNKPTWFLELNQAGTVPVLMHKDDVISESVDVCDYLEKHIPEHALTNPEYIDEEEDLRAQWDKVTGVLNGAMFGKSLDEEGGLDSVLDELYAKLEVFESTLKKRGTRFFNGDIAGVLDYIMWPHMERFCVIYLMDNQTQYTGYCLPPLPDNLQLIQQWAEDMASTEAVLKTRHTIDKHLTLSKLYRAGGVIKYDDF